MAHPYQQETCGCLPLLNIVHGSLPSQRPSSWQNQVLVEQVRKTDIDTLERCVNAVAFGDIEAEGPGSLTRVNFSRIFRLAQLTAEYLLHVQDRLAQETDRLRVRPKLLSAAEMICHPFSKAAELSNIAFRIVTEPA